VVASSGKIALSNNRVDALARLLRDKGIYLLKSRGMKTAAPVASGDTPAGREKHRRIQVWII
jgi:outer membrane protein OmpA-like peptidoglycan-associated protein